MSLHPPFVDDAADPADPHTSEVGRFSAARPAARVFAAYLPQFHPIPENDEWWGAGFTEWTNVAKARPLFPGHRQPRLPGALGYYDLRVPEVRQAQADLAAAAGIEGFCYWHYWFGNGRTILERPFREVLESGEPDRPFCLAWANQSWTGIWHGDPNRMLVQQIYPGARDDEAHFRSLIEAFTDPRYARVNGRILFALQDPSDLPEPRAFTDRWRDLAQREGIGDFHFIGDEPWAGANPQDYGFDQWVRSPSRHLPHRAHPTGWRRYRRAVVRAAFGVTVGSFRSFVDSYHRVPLEPHEVPVLVPGWDNTPRSARRGVVLTGLDEREFRRHARATLTSIHDRPAEERIVLLKSWNEWAEGNYIEPDAALGDTLLRVVREEFDGG